MPLRDILQARDAPWYWKAVTARSPVSTINAASEAPWDHGALDEDTNFVVQHPYLHWDWALESSKTVEQDTLHLVAKHPELPWAMPFVGKKATMADILKYPDIPWHWDTISFMVLCRTMYQNGAPAMQDALRNKHLPWDWHMLSRGATLDQVLQNHDVPWDWEEVTEMNGTLETFLEFPFLPWTLLQLAERLDDFRQPGSLQTLLADHPNVFLALLDVAVKEKMMGLQAEMQNMQRSSPLPWP
jgi:hypothetical protein